ncbi:MAG TPA: NAD(P)H-hydrate dehydratase [Mycobacteriales bacterium]|nr:NAD(P)H-hydrate dehydratase [Mycobacteriales bacterium]
MTLLATVERVREAERASGLPEGVLIDRASTAVARRAAAMLGRVYGARLLVVAGPGHNGADALWAAAKLADRGASADIVLPLGEPRDEHGTAPLRRLLRAPRTARRQEWLRHYDLILDGVLGTGARLWDGEPPGWTDAFAGAPVLAVDVPSGVDATTGQAAPGAVRADVTVTFGAAKTGLYLGAGAAHAGLVEVAPIGLSLAGPDGVAVLVGDPPTIATLTDAGLASIALRPPGHEADKYRRGVVGVVAGSEAYPGAAALACRGAQRAGCGYVRLVAPRAVADAVRAAYPEVVATERGGDLPKADVWVVGPGLGDDADAVRAVLATGRPVVVDADAIALVDRAALRPDVVLTPHTGEFERLIGVARADAERDRLGVTRRAAAELGCTVLLKGTTTVVVGADGAAYVNPTGTPWLGTAGTGDVLSGVVAAFLTRVPPALAAASAAWLHGLAGRLAAGSPGAAVTALDVAESLPAAARIALAP